MDIHLHSVWLMPLMAFCAQAVEAATLKSGHVVQAVGDVRITDRGATTTPAKVNTVVAETSIQTGPASRAEIAFGDRTVVRLGDNTQISVDSRSRSFDLTAGAILTEV